MQQLRQEIVDAALEMAEKSSWESVRLHHIASELGITLDQIRLEFREKEEIVDAWFDRADQAMLNFVCDSTDVAGLEQRIESAMMAWLGELGKHQKPTRQMICNKFEFGHIHYQAAGAMRVSRTVQWMREAAGLEDKLPWRAFSEAGLTFIFLCTFFYWMFDSTREYSDTRRFFRGMLTNAQPLAAILGPGRKVNAEHGQTEPDRE